MLKLVIEDGDGTTHVVPIIRDQITIGREEGNTIRLTERNVSRHHALLTRSGGESGSTIIVEDLDSYNGVKVNGVQVVRKQTLIPEDTMQIGDYYIGVESDAKSKPVASLIDTTVTEMENTEELNPVLEKDKQGRLVVVSSNLAGTSYWLSRREMLVGRSDTEGNDLVVKHRSISRHHAKFIYRDDAYTLVDLASSNGVLVNGVEAGTTSLVNGDIIEMGHVKLRYCSPGDAYVFQMTDIDDVVVVSTGQSLRLFLTVAMLLTIAGTAFLLTNMQADEQPLESQNKSKTMAANELQNPSLSEERDKAMTVLSETVAEEAATPRELLPTATTSQRALFEEAARWADNKEWSTASRVYERIIEDESIDEGLQQKAVDLKETVDKEAENLERLGLIKELEISQEDDDLSGLNLPTPDSVYYDEAKSSLERTRSKLAESLSEQFEINLESGLWQDAQNDLDALDRVGIEDSELDVLETRLSVAQKASEQEQARQRKKKRIQKKRAKTADKSKRKQTSKAAAATNNSSERKDKTSSNEGGVSSSKQGAKLRILENAHRINPSDNGIVKRLCDVSAQSGAIKKAIKYCAQHLPNEANKIKKKALERKIKRWKKSAP